VTSEPALCFQISEIKNTTGRPPCPRILAASSVIRNLDDQPLLVIHGGRNDGIFNGSQNVALNDVNVLNLVTLEWTQLAIYGIQPASRWGHMIVPNRQFHPDGIVVFGGVNLQSYCFGDIKTLQILSFGKKPQQQELVEPRT